MIDFSNFKKYDVLLITCDDNSKHVVVFDRIEENGLYSFCGTDTDKEYGVFGNARFADFEDIKSCELAKQEDIEILYDELILYFKNNPPRWNKTFEISETHMTCWLEEFCNLCFWDEDVCDIKYYVIFGKGIDFGWYTNDTIKFYQPENSKDITTTINETQPKRDIYASEFMITHMMLPETPHNVNDELEYKIIDGYEFDRVENDKIILKVVKHKYPNTPEECYKILGVTVENLSEFIFKDFHLTVTHNPSNSNEYYINLFKNFFELKICYDAYRKIAGEELGLDKSWEPDWNTSVPKYVIACTSNGIEKQWETTYCKCLAFPTEEMRDTFYENFKDLIEECKELL